ncbi:Crp/Fnr family transcriptional regulator [Paenibacillus sp. MBLB4367]|uniref:Crp/Fnr family transcriptional regulator n=1 Tax=Paenibacillus sp. MBLB4367 TaxID=3384767 RepID=UPI003908454A
MSANKWRQFYGAIAALSEIPDDQWEAFRQTASLAEYPKGGHFTTIGEKTERVGFCVSGLFRMYYTTVDGKEFNKSFCGSGDWVAAYSSVLLGVPSTLSVQALEDSELIVFRHRDLQAFYERHICWERIGRKLAEGLFVKKEAREREMLLDGAEERYTRFLREYGALAGRISQYHIASYLGITPISLSRIKNRPASH